MDNKYGLDLEIGELWYTPFWKTNLFYAIFSSILVILFVGFVYWWRFRLQQPSKQDQALAIIQSLCTTEKKPIKCDAQIFYLDLIVKFKEFIEYKYQFQLRYKTDTEVKNLLNKENLNKTHVDDQLIKIFLEILDYSYDIRFAKHSASNDQMRQDLHKTINVMQQVMHSPSEKL